MLFDIIHVADMRFPGGTSAAVAHEIRALHMAGLKVGLVQKDAEVLNNKPHLSTHPKLLEAINHGWTTLIGEGAAEARIVLLHNPHIVESMAGIGPDIRAQRTILVVHQPLASNSGKPHYDATAVNRNAALLTGQPATWAPISPISRKNCLTFGAELDILPDNWPNIIFVEDWMISTPHKRGGRPVVGRHSRPDPSKWPASLEILQQTCPVDPAYDVRLLGTGHGLDRQGLSR